ncbi:terminus macrodomain insulation protein YfbV [Thalassotalea maritima]|uniref:terminus macrodomain insulation protein YfbV n=1 Tax=Thalassotalea maritima TaxID=3242416 RepID=UPI003527C7B0
MQPTVADTYKLGRDYIKAWPERPELGNYFSQYQAVMMSRFVIKYAYSLALLATILPLMFIGIEQLRVAIFYGLFIASMPVQAVFLMAKQAKQRLPQALAIWYRQGLEKLQLQIKDKGQQHIKLKQSRPTYYDLAKLLNYSYNQHP